MKTATPELIALLNGSQQFVMADLLTITLKNGTLLRYTSADLPLTVGAATFAPFRFKRGRTRLVVGVEVDTLDVTLFVGQDDLILGIPWPRFAQNGGLDGAEITLERAFMADWGQAVAGVLWMFSGRASEVEPSRSEVRLSVKSDVEVLNTPMPRNLFQGRCGFTLYDGACQVSKAAFKASTSVASGSTRSAINCGLTQNAGWFDRGTITFTSGANAGATRTVKSYRPGVIEVALPLPATPGVGDTFDAFPGCDKSQQTCEGKFNNRPRFKGFPYVPVPETAY